MNHERRMLILECWKTIVSRKWHPRSDGPYYRIPVPVTSEVTALGYSPVDATEAVDVFEFRHDFLGRVYCEGLYIDTFPKLRKNNNGN